MKGKLFSIEFMYWTIILTFLFSLTRKDGRTEDGLVLCRVKEDPPPPTERRTDPTYVTLFTQSLVSPLQTLTRCNI